jgi:hypothetical protein
MMDVRTGQRSFNIYKARCRVYDTGIKLILDNDNALDAVVCILAGIDFLSRETMEPKESQIEIAKKEGWIWLGKSPDESVFEKMV